MTLLEGIYAVLPAEFRDFPTLAVADSASGTIDEREAQLRVLDVDLSAVTIEVLASLSAEQIIELRKAAADFFEVMKDGVGFGSFDRVCRTLKDYLTCLNRSLGLLPSASPPGRIQSSVQVLQGTSFRYQARTVIGFSHTGHLRQRLPPEPLPNLGECGSFRIG